MALPSAFACVPYKGSQPATCLSVAAASHRSMTAGYNLHPRKQECLRRAIADKCAGAKVQVQKSAEHYTEAAQDEIELLAAIAGHAHRSAEGAAACVRMLDHFEHRGPHGRHVCMVFEVRRLRFSCCAVPCHRHRCVAGCL